MSTIAEIRKQYPQYADLSDTQLAQGLHQKYYGDLPFEDFSKRIGLQPETPATPEASPVTAMDRVGALAAGVNRGVAGLAGLPIDTMQNIIDLGKAGAGFAYHEFTGKDIPDALQIKGRENVVGSGEYIANSMDRSAGTPIATPTRPDDKVSRYLYAAGQGASGGLLGPAGGARMLPSALAGITGAEAGQLAQESGASPLVQTGAALGGSLLPGGGRATLAELAKRSVRGGEVGRQTVAANIRAFDEAGATPSMGQATQNRRMQATETLLSRTPGAAGVMTNRAEQQAKSFGTNIERLASELAPKSSGQQAGAAIQKGIVGEGGFTQQFKSRQASLYDELDKFIPSGRPVEVLETQKALTTLNAEIPGAPNTSKFFQNAKIKSIQAALDADAKATGGALPYEALKKLRTLVGNELADSGPFSDVPRSKWKPLYAALSKDLSAAAEQSGPQAKAAYARANTYTRAGMNRLDVIDSVIDRNGGPESVFRAAISGNKEGATTLRAVMQSLPKDGQKMVSATVLRRLGRATPGNQDALGETFSTETFLTNWSAMAPEAKATLFNRYGANFRQDMDQVANVASNLRQGSKVFRNPSGTGQAVAQTTAATTFIVSALTGHPGTAAGIAVGVGSANLSARLMTNPNAVRWLATKTKVPVTALPALIAQLNRNDDPDLKELGKFLEQGNEQPAD